MSEQWVDQLEIDILNREIAKLRKEAADLRHKLSETEEARDEAKKEALHYWKVLGILDNC